MAKSTSSRPRPVRRPRAANVAGTSPATPVAQRVEIEPGFVGHAEIAGRAYELFLAEGARHGRDVDHWLQAERELLQRRLTSAA
ncbi:MAG TPA: DUF2934 domain-containing protein [Vicinamibacterales bacterium]|nr:DUF2934 domain-containing protein [Vicinamibacterales bacterium]